jgi:hypothetical protein
MSKREQLDGMMGMIEDVWAYFDKIYDAMSVEDWSCSHGPDWKISDLPYHLAVCRRTT